MYETSELWILRYEENELWNVQNVKSKMNVKICWANMLAILRWAK